MEGDALAVTSDVCGVDDYYAFITEVPMETAEVSVIDISTTPGTIRAKVGTTIPLSVIGIKGGSYANIAIPASECSFVSNGNTYAGVNAQGVVTAKAVGETTITVTYTIGKDTPNERAIIDVVSVKVIE